MHSGIGTFRLLNSTGLPIPLSTWAEVETPTMTNREKCINSALLTDLYELTMMQGYLQYDMNPRVVFDMFFRKQPFDGGFSIFAGLQDLLTALHDFRFSAEDLEYLNSLGLFQPWFLDYLANFAFSGDIYAVPEGTVVFPEEPLVRVHATLVEAQLIESMLLNTLNFQSLIATKAARVFVASNYGKVLEFGLRRAQGRDGALSAARAAFIGGATATSNTLAGRLYGIPVAGTMAHSWIMAFGNEEDAFRKFAELYPDNAILLIDTYDTLGSGLDGAIEIGRAMRARGKRIGVRLDSGDIQYLSRQVRLRLDEAGLHDATISVSNELTEEIVHQLVAARCPIDAWGVGTNLVTGGRTSSFTGVYKLAAKKNGGDYEPTMKVSDNPEKMTNPGVKQVHRFVDEHGAPLADLIAFADEEFEPGNRYTFFHPTTDYRKFTLKHFAKAMPMLQPYMRDGEIVGHLPDLAHIQRHTREGLQGLDETFTRILNPHIYKVSLSERLKTMKFDMVRSYASREL